MQKTREGSEIWQKRAHSTKHHPKPLLNRDFLFYVAVFFSFSILKVLNMSVCLLTSSLIIWLAEHNDHIS